MRKMNKVQITTRKPFNHCPPGPAAILGPGSVWNRVLKFIPRDRYTMLHGQCLEVRFQYTFLITYLFSLGRMNVMITSYEKI